MRFLTNIGLSKNVLGWLPWWDDFRTFKWVDSVKYPEVMAKQVRKLLFIVELL